MRVEGKSEVTYYAYTGLGLFYKMLQTVWDN